MFDYVKQIIFDDITIEKKNNTNKNPLNLSLFLIKQLNTKPNITNDLKIKTRINKYILEILSKPKDLDIKRTVDIKPEKIKKLKEAYFKLEILNTIIEITLRNIKIRFKQKIENINQTSEKSDLIKIMQQVAILDIYKLIILESLEIIFNSLSPLIKKAFFRKTELYFSNEKNHIYFQRLKRGVYLNKTKNKIEYYNIGIIIRNFFKRHINNPNIIKNNNLNKNLK